MCRTRSARAGRCGRLLAPPANVITLLCALTSLASAQEGLSKSAPIGELLTWRAPAPDWKDFVPDYERQCEREFSSRKFRNLRPQDIPPDDAPLEKLADFWSPAPRYTRLAPTAAVSARLWAYAQSDLSRVSDLLGWFPDTPQVHDRIKALVDADAGELDRRSMQGVRTWLMRYSRYFREELVERARKVTGEKGVDYWEDLAALARLDWAQATPILESLSAGKDSYLRFKVLVEQYHHAFRTKARTAGELRGNLQRVAQNLKTPAPERSEAIEVLMESEWEDRDAWFLGLFADTSLVQLEADHSIYRPSANQVGLDPDKWIPKVALLVGNKNRGIHDNAVTCLIQFHLEEARADALRPLLPWLSDPMWSSAPDRLRLIQSLDRVDLPESVPGLIWVLEHENGYELSGAAAAVKHYGDRRAVPALREALGREREEHHRREIVDALVALKGLDAKDVAFAIEAFAAKSSTAEGRQDLEKVRSDITGQASVPGVVSLGWWLSEPRYAQEDVAPLLLARAQQLQGQQPDIAKRIEKILYDWDLRVVNEWLLGKLAQAQIDAKALGSLMERRKSLLKNLPDALVKLTEKQGWVKGSGAALLGDEQVSMAILSGTDREAQRALLACARLVRMELPVPLVGELLKSPDGGLVTAAELYLEAEDSAQARALVQGAHPGDVRVFGARMGFDPGHNTYGTFDQLEKQLAEELSGENAPDEVLGLLTDGYWGGAGQRIVRVRGGKAELVLTDDSARWHAAELPADELAAMRKLLVETKADELPPLNTSVCDGLQVEYVRLTRQGGRRVFMNNPGISGTAGSPYDRIAKYFMDLTQRVPLRVQYSICRSVPGAEVLLADEKVGVQAVRKQGDELYVQVPLPRDEEKDPLGMQEESLAWHVFNQGKLGPAVERFTEGETIVPWEELQKESYGVEHLNPPLWASRVGEHFVRVLRREDASGLFLCRKGDAPRELARGTYADPLVTPDGKWVVAAKTDDTWAVPNYVVMLETGTGKEYRIDVEPADEFRPVAYVRARGKFLLFRCRDESDAKAGPAEPEHLLLDPETRKTELVMGEFRPWSHERDRQLQPAGRPDEVWVALSASTKESERTCVGRYNTRTFTFTPVVTYPDLQFWSGMAWVDEAGGRVYVAYNGHLLSLPFAFQAKRR